jgi:hypothetical protein
LSKRPFTKGDSYMRPRETDVSRRLEVNLVESGGQIVGAVSGAELTERLRPSGRRLSARAESSDGVSDLLDLRHAQAGGTDLATSPVTRSSLAARSRASITSRVVGSSPPNALVRGWSGMYSSIDCSKSASRRILEGRLPFG